LPFGNSASTHESPAGYTYEAEEEDLTAKMIKDARIRKPIRNNAANCLYLNSSAPFSSAVNIWLSTNLKLLELTSIRYVGLNQIPYNFA